MECLSAYLALPDITINDLRGSSTEYDSPLPTSPPPSEKFMTTSEPREREEICPSQHECVSMCGGMP